MIVYKTTNLINGKIYIGQSIYNNESYLGSGNLIFLDIKKYGRENFKKEILKECKNKNQLNAWECLFIKKFDSANPNIGYNISKKCYGKGAINDKVKEKLSNRMKEYYSNPKNLVKLSRIIKKSWNGRRGKKK